MEQSNAFIPATDVIKTGETTLDSLDAVTNHVQQRGTFFLNRLSILGKNINRGFEMITYDENNAEAGVQKERDWYNDMPEFSEKGLFTAEGFCGFASRALREGLARVSINPNLTYEIVRLRTDFNAEQWKNPHYYPSPSEHDIVQVRDTSNG